MMLLPRCLLPRLTPFPIVSAHFPLVFSIFLKAFSLSLRTAAKDSLRQRKGRAGRVGKGRCYRLITFSVHERLPAQSIPEMLRLPLDNVLLQTLAMTTSTTAPGQGRDCLEILKKCPDPPSLTHISAAQRELLSLDAIHATTNESFALTPLGVYLSRLPLTPRIARLLVYGCLLQCPLPAAIIAAAMTSSSKSPFLAAQNNDKLTQNNILEAKKTLLNGRAGSDYEVIVQAVLQFVHPAK